MEQSNDGRQNGDTRLDERPDPIADTYHHVVGDVDPAAGFDGTARVKSETSTPDNRIAERLDTIRAKSRSALEIISEIKLERAGNVFRPTMRKVAIGAGIAAVGSGIAAKRRHDNQKRNQPRNLLQRATDAFPFRR
jgi:hypothetical protein